MLRILIGDILQSKAQAIVNTVNCVGIMGKGIAAEFKKKYPSMYDDYVKLCNVKKVCLGEPYPYQDESGILIINFPTKKHWRSPSRLTDVIKGLDYLVAHVNSWQIKSLAIPPLGCGNGGLEWSNVGPIMYQKLNMLNIPIEIYAPYGTPQSQLTLDFLAQKITNEKLKGRQQYNINPVWLTILEVIDQLAKQPYANPVGRTIFQKIAYVLTEQGINTGFNFNQGSYGPFSTEMKDALKLFTNSNLVKEEMLGRMMAIHVGSSYPEFKDKYCEIINSHNEKIEKTVDLFSRIKNTEQAEEVATVLYAIRKLKNGKDKIISEKELCDYILNWKKNWNKEDKREVVTETIRNLEMLGWVHLQYNELLRND